MPPSSAAAVAAPENLLGNQGAGSRADPLVAWMLAAGMAMMVIASFMRRRHRRRIGWGVLPDRTLFVRYPFAALAPHDRP